MRCPLHHHTTLQPRRLESVCSCQEISPCGPALFWLGHKANRMPAPAVGIIITVTVLVAASIAVYENPQVKAWIDRQRHKISMGLHSLGDDIGPRPRPQPRRTSTDVSMQEEKGDLAAQRRREAIAEIMERGRVLEEKRKRRKLSQQGQPPSPTFDSLVDGNGILLKDVEAEQAQSSGADPATGTSDIRQRNAGGAADASTGEPQSSYTQAFESRYEQEMREAWNLPLSDRRIEMPSSHASESLIELTPTTESAPDPDFSVPSVDDMGRSLHRSDYFSLPPSNSTHTLSDRGSHAASDASGRSNPFQDEASGATTPSISSSVSHIGIDDAAESSDGIVSELGDGIRTPASAWTDLSSTVSGDFQL
jgi:hypothetical protein